MFTKPLVSVALLLTVTLGGCAFLENNTVSSTPATNSADDTAEAGVDKPEETASTANSSTTAEIRGTVLNNASRPTEIQSQITIPEGWVEDRDLHDSAELQASYRAQEMYVIVLSENRADFQDITLQEHSDITRGLLTESLTNVTQSEPTTLTINGAPALQYQINGSIDNINVAYLHTTVETPNNFHQILAWTLPSAFERNEPTLQQVIRSFQEQ